MTSKYVFQFHILQFMFRLKVIATHNYVKCCDQVNKYSTEQLIPGCAGEGVRCEGVVPLEVLGVVGLLTVCGVDVTNS